MIAQIAHIPEREIAAGITARFLHTENNTLAFVELEKDALLPAHNHVHEQTTRVMKGRLEITVNGKKQMLEEGAIITIDSYAEHSARAITPCTVMDVFYPVREDYK